MLCWAHRGLLSIALIWREMQAKARATLTPQWAWLPLAAFGIDGQEEHKSCAAAGLTLRAPNL
jgi:hypothetical protein